MCLLKRLDYDYEWTTILVHDISYFFIISTIGNLLVYKVVPDHHRHDS